MENLHKKTKANAVSAYLLIGINWAFLLNKENEYINNSFVKSHTKTALIIHLGLLGNLIIFVWNNPLTFFAIFGYNLGDMIAIIIFLVLTGFIFLGALKAKTGEYFYTKDLIKFSGNKKLLDVNGDLKINEKDKLTLVLVHIPFLGAYLYGKYANYKIVQIIGKLNLYITTLILLLYIGSNQNLANIILLIYIIYNVFIGINLFTNQKIIQINLDFLPTPRDMQIHCKTLLQYLYQYFKKERFINYNDLKNNIIEINREEEKALEKKLQALPKTQKLEKYSIYIQSVIVLFILGLTIIFTDISNKWLLVIFLILLYIIGYIKYSLTYKAPFIYDIYNISAYIGGKIKSFFIKTKKLHQKEEITTIKVSEK